MKAAFFTGIRRIEIWQTEPPRMELATQVRVRIERVGVCGSDVHYYLHGRIGDQILQLPASLGHECAGRVVEVGPAVHRVKQGDLVAIDPAIVCGRCDQCLADRPNTCRHLQFLGAPGEAPGAVREYLVLPEENCFPLPAGLTLDHAVLAEPLSIGLYAARLARLEPKERVAIFGCGPIGLSVLVWVKLLAGCRVYATDLLNERLAAARRLGADWTGNPQQQDTTAAILQEEPLGVDCVFECSGDAICVSEGIRLAKPGARLLWLGIPPDEQVAVPAHLARRKEITLQLVRRQRGCIQPVLDAMAQGRLDPLWWITHRYPLEKIDEAFELVAQYRDGVLKAIIHLPE
ncbi:MAG: alcohol dehydrogenase catalytic domain-containing protein [Thermoguttaceae bacterium]|nr:alcohol dehydrogenase catalytic domain-containing protein [Thermoguttaceae bacterium]MDW8036886.1 alcohol dehydrogenase catalytic domain-containing protein [Thermoguttaceae bacterium]